MRPSLELQRFRVEGLGFRVPNRKLGFLTLPIGKCLGFPVEMA